MKVLVTGSTGQLGHDVCAVLAARGVQYEGVNSADCDITDVKAVSALFEREKPDTVIHCAAYTNVDQAEDEPGMCWSVNVDGTRFIAENCRMHGVKMVYISTDYVFPGTGEQMYGPGDPVGPVNVYGASKLGGELAVKSLLSDYFIVRISWVFGMNGCNFVRTMLRLAETHDMLRVVDDQIGSPTYTADLAPLLCDMAATERYGIYHATNEGLCSWADFAEEIFRVTGKAVKVERVPSNQYPVKAARPLNSRMNKSALEQNGFYRLPEWGSALRRFLETEQVLRLDNKIHRRTGARNSRFY